MVLDTEEQRQIILAAINAASFPGKIVEMVVDVKRAVIKAEVIIKTECLTETK